MAKARRQSLLSSVLIVTCSQQSIPIPCSEAASVAALALPPTIVRAAVGALSGSAGALASYPFDYVKAQLQTEYGRSTYDNGIDAFVKIVRGNSGGGDDGKNGIIRRGSLSWGGEGGPLALYRGVEVSLLGIMPESAVAFGVDEAAKSAFLALRTTATASPTGLSPSLELLAGALAGTAQVVVTNPVEAIKIQKQTSDRDRNATLADLYGQLGGTVWGLYRGAGMCALRDATFTSVLFFSYPRAIEAVEATVGAVGPVPDWVVKVLAGCIAASPAACLATPADVIKTRVQQARREDIVVSEKTKEVKKEDSSAMGIATKMVREDGGGPTVFFSGWLERVARYVPQYGVTLCLYDILTNLAFKLGML